MLINRNLSLPASLRLCFNLRNRRSLAGSADIARPSQAQADSSLPEHSPDGLLLVGKEKFDVGLCWPYSRRPDRTSPTELRS